MKDPDRDPSRLRSRAMKADEIEVKEAVMNVNAFRFLASTCAKDGRAVYIAQLQLCIDEAKAMATFCDCIVDINECRISILSSEESEEPSDERSFRTD